MDLLPRYADDLAGLARPPVVQPVVCAVGLRHAVLLGLHRDLAAAACLRAVSLALADCASLQDGFAGVNPHASCRAFALPSLADDALHQLGRGLPPVDNRSRRGLRCPPRCNASPPSIPCSPPQSRSCRKSGSPPWPGSRRAHDDPLAGGRALHHRRRAAALDLQAALQVQRREAHVGRRHRQLAGPEMKTPSWPIRLTPPSIISSGP